MNPSCANVFKRVCPQRIVSGPAAGPQSGELFWHQKDESGGSIWTPPVCLHHADFTASESETISLFVFQKTADVVEELLMVLRNQQRELMQLRGQIETMQSSILSQVERVLTNHQEQERILVPQRSSQGPTRILLLECDLCGP